MKTTCVNRRILIIITGIVTLFFNSAFGQLISIESNTSRDDGSLKLTDSEKARIKPFSNETIDSHFFYKSKEDILFEYIDGDQFKTLCSKHRCTWLFIQSAGCGACSVSLKKYMLLADSLAQYDIRIVVVNQDIHVRQLQKKIFNEGYSNLSYIIIPEKYGTIEKQKQKQFIADIIGPDLPASYNIGAAPQNFFFNKEEELIYYSPINNINGKVLEDNVLPFIVRKGL